MVEQAAVDPSESSIAVGSGVFYVVLFEELPPETLAEGVVRLVFRATQAKVRQSNVNIRDGRERRTGIEKQDYASPPTSSISPSTSSKATHPPPLAHKDPSPHLDGVHNQGVP